MEIRKVGRGPVKPAIEATEDNRIPLSRHRGYLQGLILETVEVNRRNKCPAGRRTALRVCPNAAPMARVPRQTGQQNENHTLRNESIQYPLLPLEEVIFANSTALNNEAFG